MQAARHSSSAAARQGRSRGRGTVFCTRGKGLLEGAAEEEIDAGNPPVLGGALAHAHLDWRQGLALSLACLKFGERAVEGRALVLASTVQAEDGVPRAQLHVGPIGHLALLHRLAENPGAVAGQILEQAARSIGVERHVLTADLGIRNDDVTVLAPAEHQAAVLERHSEHFLTATIEDQLWHVSPC